MKVIDGKDMTRQEVYDKWKMLSEKFNVLISSKDLMQLAKLLEISEKQLKKGIKNDSIRIS